MNLKVGNRVKVLEKKLFSENETHTGELIKMDYDPSHEVLGMGAKDEYRVKLDNGKEIVIDPTYKIYNKYEILEVLG